MRYLLIIAALIAGCSDSSDHNSSQKALDDFKNRTVYTSLDVETLRAIPDDEVEQAVVDYVVRKLESASDEGAVLKSLSDGNRALWLTWIVDGEVNNGGFNQYYLNTDG